MADFATIDSGSFKPKSFWKRPEGITGTLFLAGILAGGGYLLYKFLPALIALTTNILYLSLLLMALAAVIYVILDPKMRNLIWYMYKSVMRWLTGIFVNIDPIGILKSYVDELTSNLGKMSKQIGILKGQMRQLKTLMEENAREIQNNMKLASKAKEQNLDNQVILSTRKAARLQESNEKYEALLKKMDILYRVLTKMYENSEILLEDTKDQVALKEQERKAIRTSYSAMKSAMSIISGDKDQRAMFDMALEAIADDVANKVGEMERFMEMSSNFMNSVDLQNGVFEDEGLKMLDQWEKESSLMLMGGKKSAASGSTDSLQLKQLDSPEEKKDSGNGNSGSGYDQLFS